MERVLLEIAWNGRSSLKVNTTIFQSDINGGSSPTHRLKIDEEENFVITTSYTGGLIVRDIDTHEVLFKLLQVRESQSKHNFPNT